ncbi:MAG: hypothetical protein KME43_13205 [Myxacorys chilensis ATA2-1-KO14]|jgi:hypothetical protein|nr:hypothetical protein [Myxacorys chilensis ATA2-1-KO14]
MISAHPSTGALNSFDAPNYWNRLHPWCVIRLQPQMQRIVIARFRKRSGAEEYLKVVGRLIPTATHQIVFDPMPSESETD